jgi:hypothetical protein
VEVNNCDTEEFLLDTDGAEGKMKAFRLVL